MKSTITALTLTFVLASFLTSAQAHDLSPAPFRGGPLSTVAEWDFLTPNAGPPDGTSVPTVIGNSGGIPLAAPGQGLAWSPFIDQSGAWQGTGNNGGIISFEIPNWVDKEPIKYLHIQMTYLTDPAQLFPSVSFISAQDPLGITSITHTGTTDGPIPGTVLNQRVEDWQILPNPDFELIQIHIPANVFLSQVVIDTISVPEPSSLVLGSAALGALALAAMVRRKQRSK